MYNCLKKERQIINQISISGLFVKANQENESLLYIYDLI